MSEPILKAEHLGITFGGLKAVSDFNMTINAGELVGLIGPNGAGKTTVFNLLTGVYQPTEGEFFLDGKRMNGKKTYQVVRAGIARTFQNIRLFDQMTVEENVLVAFNESFTYRLGGAIFRTPTFWKQERDMHAKAIDLLRIFGLEGLAETEAANLPYGAQRKLEIARALATGMKLLLLDEPAAGMNPTETEDLLNCINTIRDRFGIAILLIHHLRKELADDVFSRISGTTAISGAVDSSFTLVEDKRGSGKAKLSCIGRDIEYRELTLERNAENVWELVSDSRTQLELLGGRIVILLSELMRDRAEFIGTPTELSAQIDPAGSEGITPKKVSRLILQSVAALSKIGISAVVRRSNGKRLIELRRAESDDAQGTQAVDPIDPADVSGGENAPCFAL